jgi:hypothetical protein
MRSMCAFGALAPLTPNIPLQPTALRAAAELAIGHHEVAKRMRRSSEQFGVTIRAASFAGYCMALEAHRSHWVSTGGSIQRLGTSSWSCLWPSRATLRFNLAPKAVLPNLSLLSAVVLRRFALFKVSCTFPRYIHLRAVHGCEKQKCQNAKRMATSFIRILRTETESVIGR